ncbi:hypothetical protein [Paracoccus methylarcula]|nr:hypothetical protein [Paracoccus methylarcula]
MAMKLSRRQKRAASRYSNDHAEATADLPHGGSTGDLDKSANPGQRLWPGKKASVRDMLAALPEPPAIADDMRPDDIGNPVAAPQESPDSSRTAERSTSSQSDESSNAHPSDAGAVDDVTDIGKEKQMQTAEELKPFSDSGIAEKVDLRLDDLVKSDSAQDKEQALTPGGLGSLFGPIIEDEVKGVRSQIREMIQGELQGELGQRFSRNLRIVIRREIAAAVEDQFDRV